MRKYPKKRNGDEYYPKTGDNFVVDRDGKEIYARDRTGKELYPNREDNVFARDATGDFYYAKDARGNEYYPVRGNRSLFIVDHTNQNIRLALMADKTQRYPQDGKGNEYYWRENGEPLLMRTSTGERYLAKSRNGHALIPWNYMKDYISNEPCVYSKDSNGNTVYVKESAFPPAFKALIRCICHISVICPKVTGCHTRFY